MCPIWASNDVSKNQTSNVFWLKNGQQNFLERIDEAAELDNDDHDFEIVAKSGEIISCCNMKLANEFRYLQGLCESGFNGQTITSDYSLQALSRMVIFCYCSVDAKVFFKGLSMELYMEQIEIGDYFDGRKFGVIAWKAFENLVSMDPD